MRIHAPTHPKTVYSIFGIVVLIAIGVSILGVTNTIDFFGTHKPAPSVTASENTKGEGTPTVSKTPSSTPTAASSASSTQPGDQKNATSGAVSTSLLMPTGDFVSAHGKSDQPLPSNALISSVCNTTPGASCKVTFTSSDGTVKNLPAQITDRGGSTYWNGWKLSDYGITSGSWKIEAIATQGSETKVAMDALPLEVAE